MSPRADMPRERIVAAARTWIGTPYLHQASLKGAGCDCLGLVRGVWRDLYGEEPEDTGAYTPDWAEASRQERLADAGFRHLTHIGVQDFAAGDVLLFRWRANVPAKHCAIATSRDSMIHAHDGARVCEVAISHFWRRRAAFAFAFPGVGA
ncbi:MAG: C40 family peptidase [Beijerinckiaceae bacterium]|nr:C40 family peptidase [Beijerinckiaceae bacterium]